MRSESASPRDGTNTSGYDGAADSWPGNTGVLTLAGMFGALGQVLGGGAFWPGVVGALFGATVGIVVSLG